MKQKSKWNILSIHGITSGKIVSDIYHKLPKAASICTGIMVSANSKGKEEKDFLLGILSLHTKNKKTHPIHITVKEKAELHKGKRKILSIKEGDMQGTIVQGYYSDRGDAENYPYTLRIYFQYQ